MMHAKTLWSGSAALLGAIAVILMQSPEIAAGPKVTAPDDDRMWPLIRKDLFANRPISEEDGTIIMDAPYRAEDAALVPIKITIPREVAKDTKSLTLVVEKNPDPVVAKFKFGPAAGLGERRISTRVRVDMYSNITAIIERSDGRLHMTTRFVKAAGGCSAPALKDAEAAIANLGKIKLRQLKPKTSSPISREAQVMVRHPNYSGFQMNQLTQLYIPAQYVEYMAVHKADRLVFEMEGGISLSEDPNIRFTYEGGAANPLHVSVRDSDGKVFKATAPSPAYN